jgi:hypothetical protein
MLQKGKLSPLNLRYRNNVEPWSLYILSCYTIVFLGCTSMNTVRFGLHCIIAVCRYTRNVDKTRDERQRVWRTFFTT